MKKIVVTKSQAKRLTEDNNVNLSINSTGNTIPSAIDAVSKAQPKISTASKLGDPILHISNPSSTNGSDDSKITQHVEVPAGQTPEQAMQSQLNPAATNGGDIEVSGEGISECRHFKKKQLEKLRISIIKENATIFKKKDIISKFNN